MAGNLRTSFLAMAARNLLRNGWRSGLTAGGIAVSVAMMIWTIAMMDGFSATMIRGATSVELGQVQLHRADYADKARPERSFAATGRLLATLRGVDQVVDVTPRVRLWGLMGNEQRSQITRIVGVDAVHEAAVTLVAGAVKQGKWLSHEVLKTGPHEVVLGAALAKQLGVKVGEELVAFLQATDGSLGNDVFVVRGIVQTGNQLIDRTTAFVHLDDARTLGALAGQVHELAIKTERLDNVALVADAIKAAMTAAGLPLAVTIMKIDPDEQDFDATVPLLVQTWHELAPDLFQMIQVNSDSTSLLYFIIYFIAILSIVNTQRMSAWERRREFGVMLAIGMSPLRLFRLVMFETFLLALAGTIGGALVGTLVASWHASVGLDMALFTDNGSFSYMGIAFNERIFFQLDVHTIVEPALVMLVVGSIAGAWPAWRAMRLQPAATIAGRT